MDPDERGITGPLHGLVALVFIGAGIAYGVWAVPRIFMLGWDAITTGGSVRYGEGFPWGMGDLRSPWDPEWAWNPLHFIWSVIKVNVIACIYMLPAWPLTMVYAGMSHLFHRAEDRRLVRQ